MEEGGTGGASDIGAHGKWRGFIHGATMRHRSRTRVSKGFFLLFVTFSAVVECFLGRFPLF